MQMAESTESETALVHKHTSHKETVLGKFLESRSMTNASSSMHLDVTHPKRTPDEVVEYGADTWNVGERKNNFTQLLKPAHFITA